MNNQIKIAPNSKENEMMVLGCMLSNSESLKNAIDDVDDSDFYCIEHKTIFAALKALYHDNRPVDVHLVCEDLKESEKLKSVGGAAYIVTLAQYGGTSAYVEEYIKDLKESARKRHLIALSQEIRQQALNNGNSIEIIGKAVEEIKRIEKNKGAKEKFQIKFLDQFGKNFLRDNPPKKQMLLDYASDNGVSRGFLPKGIVAMLAGAGGVGKTHLLAQLAIAMSTGTPLLDIFKTTEHCGEQMKGSVFLGLGENQYDDIHRLLYKASQKLRQHQPDITKEDLLTEASQRIAVFSFCGHQASFIEAGKPSLYFRRLKAMLIEIAPKEGWSLIILDPVSRLMGADAEKDNSAATQFIAILEELTIDLQGNPTVLFAHHVSKAAQKEENGGGQTAARGASALTDGVRWQCNLSKEVNNEIAIRLVKTNLTAPLEPIYIKKNNDGYLEKSNLSSEKIETEHRKRDKKNSPTKY